MMIGIVVLGGILALAAWAVSVYNGLVQLNVRGDNAWSDIDVQLKRRYDVIPNIVATVEGYAKHERTTLQSVIEARAKAMSTTGVAEKGQTEDVLTNTLKSLFVIVEKYPDLKANESFLRLQTTLIEIEETIQAARRYYNAVVRDYNTMVQMFPAVIIAGAFNFKLREFFQLNAPEVERQSPQVKIDLQN
ncbi:MAG: LemA family protein [Candidatus Omnitrophota bacterium]|jgi:LemA protein